MSLGHGRVKGLALLSSDGELQSSGLAAAICAGESSRAPGRATVDLLEVGELRKYGLVAQGNVDEAVVGQSRHGGDGCGLLAAAEGTGADEETGVLAPEGALLPLLASLVPEGLELGREVAVAGGDAEEDGVVRLEIGGVVQDRNVGGLGRGVHLAEDVVGECLGNLEEGGITASLADTLEFSLCLWWC